MIKIESYDSVITWSYKLAKDWIQENLVSDGVNSSRKFEEYKRQGNYLPKNFPRKPDEFFKKKEVWQGWADFFGKSSNYSDREYHDYNYASELCKRLGIQNSIDYRNWPDRPAKLPARPDQYYKEKWKGWKNFLGNNYEIPERKVSSKLRQSDVRIIKHQLKLGISGAILARTFGVSEMQISRIKKGENWSNI